MHDHAGSYSALGIAPPMCCTLRWVNLQRVPHQPGCQAWGSSLTHSIFVNDLLLKLQSSGFGARVGELVCGSPMYADDLALVASSPKELMK